MMKNNNYSGAIEKFKLARKVYKRAKISEHEYNYININQALCYAKINDHYTIIKLCNKHS